MNEDQIWGNDMYFPLYYVSGTLKIEQRRGECLPLLGMSPKSFGNVGQISQGTVYHGVESFGLKRYKKLTIAIHISILLARYGFVDLITPK